MALSTVPQLSGHFSEEDMYMVFNRTIVFLSVAVTVVLLFPVSFAASQEFSTDVRVNHLSDGDQEIDESGALAISGCLSAWLYLTHLR